MVEVSKHGGVKMDGLDGGTKQLILIDQQIRIDNGPRSEDQSIVI